MDTDNLNLVFVYRIDGNNRFVYVNDEWLQFAIDNGAEHLTREAVLGRNIFFYIDNLDVKLLWSRLLDKVRSTRGTANVNYRCDSADTRRFMHMELRLLHDNIIEFRSRIRKLETRRPVTSLDYSFNNCIGFRIMCSWCKRIHIGESKWAEVEDAVNTLDLFGGGQHIAIKNSMCGSCYERIMNTN